MVNTLGALMKLYDQIPNKERMYSDIHSCVTTEHTARSGRPVIWYYDDRLEIAIYADTLEFLTSDEIVKELL